MFIATWLPYAMLALFGWGVTAFLPKLALKSLSPRHLIVYHSLFFLCGVSLVQLFYGGPEFEPRGVLLALATGFSGSLGQLIYLEALRRGPLIYVSMISSLYSLVATVLSCVLLHAPLTPRHAAGVLLGVASIVLLGATRDK
ncbi:MAG: EamA family transporter [Alphaproteobacteria bacterium]|nr:EamA family transporter [Alphaproteobacteria bacterium]